MAVTQKITLTGAWKAVATAGEVTITPTHQFCFWAVTGGATPPNFEEGHVVNYVRGASMTLTGSERLWVKGGGSLYVTADAPV